MYGGIRCSKLIFPCGSPLNTTIHPRNNLADDYERTLEGRKKMDWLRSLGLEKTCQTELLDFIFVSSIWQTGLRRGLQPETAMKHRKKIRKTCSFWLKNLEKSSVAES